MKNKIEIYKTEADAIEAAISEISNQVPDMLHDDVKEKAYRYKGQYATKWCSCDCGETDCVEYNMEHEGKFLIGRAGVCESCGN